MERRARTMIAPNNSTLFREPPADQRRQATWQQPRDVGVSNNRGAGKKSVPTVFHQKRNEAHHTL
jgi:hypothetical protein